MLKVYFTPGTRAGRVVWLLEELGIDYDVDILPFTKEGLKSPEHRSRHALGRVPVLEDGDISIFESGAIIQYILERHKDGGLKPSTDSEEFPYYLQWLHYAEGSIMPQVNTIVVETILLPPERKNDVNVARALKLLNVALLNVNNSLENKDFLTGTFSGADIMTGHACIGAKRVGADISNMANVGNYINRLLSRPALQKAMKI